MFIYHINLASLDQSAVRDGENSVSGYVRSMSLFLSSVLNIIPNS